VNLHTAIAIYSQSKRDVGIPFQSGTAFLNRFEGIIGNIDIIQIGRGHVDLFLDRSQLSPSVWEDRFLLLRRFLEYWQARHCIARITMPERHYVVPTSFVPYIYTRDEIRRLLAAIPSLEHSHRKTDTETLKMIILFLYTTGISTGDIIRIQHKDFDFRKRELTLFATSKGISRRLPLSPELCTTLRAHKRRNPRSHRDDPFFQTKKGAAITHFTLNVNFRSIRDAAKVGRAGNRRVQPRLIDLRHTFAVHRIAAWLRHGADLNRMMPALSAYLGFICLSTAERYLRLNPERFRKQLDLLSNEKQKPMWRRDKELMAFLDGL
jgi:integrase